MVTVEQRQEVRTNRTNQRVSFDAMSGPLHASISARLESSIRSGTWPPGARLPAERDLVRTFAVSRATIRQALADLAGRGLVRRRQGSGTFVAEPPVAADITASFSISAALMARGLRLTTRLLGAEIVEAERAVAQDLGLPPASRVVRFERLRTVESEPLILEVAHLPVDLFPGLEREDVTTRSLYDILASAYGRVVASATETIEPVILSPRESELLGVALYVPGLLVRRVTFDRDGTRVESSQALLRGDRSRFLLELKVTDLEPVAVRTELIVEAGGR